MKRLLILLVMSGLLWNCSDDRVSADDGKEESEITESDPFDILDVEIENGLLKVKVSYGGGCREHIFEVVWPEVITAIFPPDVAVTINHEGNDDPCFAMITEVVEFDFDESGHNFSDEAIAQMRITVINGFDNTQQVSNR